MEERRLMFMQEQESVQPQFTQLMSKRQEILQMIDADKSGLSGPSVESALKEVNTLEAQILKKVSESGGGRETLSLPCEEVRHALPADAVVVDYLRYRKCDKPNVWMDYYGAIVLSNQHEPRWLPLGKSEEIDKLVLELNSRIEGDMQNRDARRILSRLHELLCEPVRKLIGDKIAQLIISPDSQLNFVPFAALLDSEEHFLVESYNITKIGSSRDVLRKGLPLPPNCALLVVANPEIELLHQGAGAESNATTFPSIVRGVDVESLLKNGLRPLAWSHVEADDLKAQALIQHWDFEALEWKDATKVELERRLARKSPEILHFATHCDRLKRTEKFTGGIEGNAPPPLMIANSFQVSKTSYLPTAWLPIVSGGGDDPNSSNALMLSGAVNTLREWQSGVFTDPHEDGILTADQVVQFDLRNTWLVVLDACGSGKGGVLQGQGAWGFQRSFVLAGARNVLTTLWAIRDETARNFMLEFYRHLQMGKSPSRSLCEVQKERLVQLKNSQGLVVAVRYAAPYSVLATSLQ